MDIEKHFGEFVTVAIIIIIFCGLGFVAMNAFAKNAVDDVISQKRQMLVDMKGSIYESGEAMSVFGTCMDAYGIPVINSTANFSAWYPNGTQFIFGENMTKLQEGYFLYTGIMSVVEGTYLTQMICEAVIDGDYQFAKAWGEWQNPFWVNRIRNISDQISNLSLNISVLQENISNNFNYTNSLIVETQLIANASVDRNNSLLAQLLYYLINASAVGNVTWTEYSVDPIVYWRDWTIKVKVRDGDGDIVSSPQVACTINTTLTPLEYMDEEGDHFTATVFIYSWDFDWATNCFYT